MLNFIIVIISVMHHYCPLGVHSAKHRRQSPEWMILSHVDCFIQGEIIGFQVLLDSLHSHSTRMSWWSPPVLQLRSSWHLFRLAFVQWGETPCLDNG